MGRIAADENKQIPMGRWEEWCDLFTNGNAGRPISVELVGNEEGAVRLADEVALVAIDYDPADKGNAMVISYGASSAPSSHTVNKPAELWQGQDENGLVVALEIVTDSGDSVAILLN